jgi:hypothetical protein
MDYLFENKFEFGFDIEDEIVFGIRRLKGY